MSDNTNAGQTEQPVKLADTGRDAKGRYVQGSAGNPNGRPRRPDIYALAAQHAERTQMDLAAQLVGVVQSMINRALSGDVAAAKLILDRLTDSDPVKLEVSGMDPAARVAQIRALLQAAAMRQEPGALLPQPNRCANCYHRSQNLVDVPRGGPCPVCRSEDVLT